jgi:hypothetical protein
VESFQYCVQIPEFGTEYQGLDWRTPTSTQSPYLPPSLAVWRIPGPKSYPALHWGVCIIFETDGQAECLIQSPHGLNLDEAAVLKNTSPSVKTLALLHTTKQSTYNLGWAKANLGAEHGAQVAELVEPRYCKCTLFFLLFDAMGTRKYPRKERGVYGGRQKNRRICTRAYIGSSLPLEGIATHDEMVSTTGFNKWLLSDNPRDAEGVVKEAQENGKLEGLELSKLEMVGTSC